MTTTTKTSVTTTSKFIFLNKNYCIFNVIKVFFCKGISCLSNPCQNGGMCYLNSLGQVACTCTSYFTGYYCEATIDVCVSIPCQNGGTCKIPNGSGYRCTCVQGYTGINCEIKMSTQTTKTTTTTLTTMSPKTCVDYNSTLCQSYAAKGYCSLNVYVNGALISVSCAASCNPSCKTTTYAITTTTITKTCSDYNPSLCQTYASKGYCSLNIKFIRDYNLSLCQTILITLLLKLAVPFHVIPAFNIHDNHFFYKQSKCFIAISIIF